MKKLFYHWLFILFTLVLLIQKPYPAFAGIEVYDSKDGLSENQITAIAKDQKGLMWIATKNGLNTFDGYTFNKIQGILNSVEITNLLFDSGKSILWIGTRQGLFYINTNTFQAGKLPDSKNSSSAVFSFCLLNSKIFVLFQNGSVEISEDTKPFTQLTQLDANKLHPAFLTILPDSTLLIVTNQNYQLDWKQKKTIPLPAFKKNITGINTISHFDEQKLIISTSAGNIFLYNLLSHEENSFPILKKASLKKRLFFFIHAKNKKVYWAFSNYEFQIVNTQTNQIKAVSEENKNNFDGKQFNCLFVDELGIVWIGTNKGIIKYKEQENLFEKILHPYPLKISTRNIIEGGVDNLLIASYNGLYSISIKKKANETEINQNVIPFPTIPYSLLKTKDYVYIGLETDGLFRWNLKNKTLETNFYKGEFELNSSVSMIQDPTGTIWIGGGNGLFSFNPQTQKMSLHKNDIFDLGEVTVRQLSLSNDQKKLMIGTTNGFFLIDLTTKQRIHLNKLTIPALSNEDIFYVYQDQAQAFWLATNGGGINKISKNLKTIDYIKKENGLSNDIAYCILPEGNDYLWISTFDGLNRLNKENHSLVNYYKEQGLTSDEFNKNSALLAKDGKMYFGGIDGISTFYPKKISEEKLNSFHIFLSSVVKWDNQTKSIFTNYKVNDPNTTIKKTSSDAFVELYFGISDYSDPSVNKFLYRIKGIYDDWISLGNYHSFNISGLPYGKYVLEIKSLNSRGTLSENILKINLNIEYPFYNRIWFYVLILLFISLIIYSIYSFKINKIKSLVELRLNLSSNLHDEVGSLLTRITMFADNLRHTPNSKEQQGSKLRKIAELSREATFSMSDVLWTLDSRNDFVGNLMDRMKEHAENMLENQGFKLKIQFQEMNSKQHLSSETRRNIYLIFKEAIHNVAKYAVKESEVDISFSLNEKKLLLCITNQLDKNSLDMTSGSGQGLKNMKMRARKINADFNLSQTDHQFIFTLKK